MEKIMKNVESMQENVAEVARLNDDIKEEQREVTKLTDSLVEDMKKVKELVAIINGGGSNDN